MLNKKNLAKRGVLYKCLNMAEFKQYSAVLSNEININKIIQIPKDVHSLYTYSFFLAREVFLLGLSLSESLLPCKQSVQSVQSQLCFRLNCNCTSSQRPLGGTRGLLMPGEKNSQALIHILFSKHLLTPAPIFKRAGSCRLRFDRLTP